MIKRLLGSRFVRDSATLQASSGVIALLQLTSTVAVANLIGDVQQGVFFTAFALYSLWFMLLNTGVMQATVIQLASSVAEQRGDRAAAWLAFLVKIYALAGVVLLGIGWALLPWVAEGVLNDRRVGELAWWLTAMPLLELPRVVAQASFQAVRRMGDLARLELINEVLRVLLVVGATLVLRDVRGPLLGTVLAAGMGSIVGAALYTRAARGEGHKLPTIRVILSRVWDVPVRRGLALGVRIGYLRSLDAMFFNVLPVLFIKSAGALAGRPEASVDALVAHFKIAWRVMQVPTMLLQGIGRTALPALSQMAGRRDATGFQRAFMRVTVLSGMISLAGMVSVLLARPFLPWVIARFQFPDTYHEPVARIIAVLAVGTVTVGLSVGFDAFFVATNRLRVTLRILTLGFLVTSPAMYWLAYSLPETGAAWGLVLGQAWVLPNLVYILLFFRSGGHRRAFEAMPRRA